MTPGNRAIGVPIAVWNGARYAIGAAMSGQGFRLFQAGSPAPGQKALARRKQQLVGDQADHHDHRRARTRSATMMVMLSAFHPSPLANAAA